MLFLNRPLEHRDPFDRLLVAQAQIEPLILMSDDPLVARYDVSVQVLRAVGAG